MNMHAFDDDKCLITVFNVYVNYLTYVLDDACVKSAKILLMQCKIGLLIIKVHISIGAFLQFIMLSVFVFICDWIDLLLSVSLSLCCSYVPYMWYRVCELCLVCH